MQANGRSAALTFSFIRGELRREPLSTKKQAQEVPSVENGKAAGRLVACSVLLCRSSVRSRYESMSPYRFGFESLAELRDERPPLCHGLLNRG